MRTAICTKAGNQKRRPEDKILKAVRAVFFYISISVLLLIIFACSENKKTDAKDNSEPSKNSNFEIVYKKTWGLTDVYMCYTQTNDYDKMKEYGTKLVEDKKVAFVYFYDNKNKVKDIRKYKDLDDALPDSGYVAKLDKSPGFGIQFEK